MDMINEAGIDEALKKAEISAKKFRERRRITWIDDSHKAVALLVREREGRHQVQSCIRGDLVHYLGIEGKEVVCTEYDFQGSRYAARLIPKA